MSKINCNHENIYNNKQIYNLMKDYYENYYYKCLKLSDWEERFKNYRLNEEEKHGKKIVDFFKNHKIDFDNKKILIVGAGTGAELFYFFKNFNSICYGVEPFDDAVNILNAKAELLNFPKENIKKAFAESLPFEDNFFDIVICFTVLEHVEDVEKSIMEMYRVLNGGGTLMIATPNYLFPEEPHYKVTIFPPKISKKIARLNLKLYGRYTEFFETLNFFSCKDIYDILIRNNIEYKRKNLYLKYSSIKSFIRFFPRYLASFFGISRNQLIFITKDKNE